MRNSRLLSALARIIREPLVVKFVSHLTDPLYRSGYALVFSSIAGSALGMFYWLLAARYYSVETIGMNSAIIASITFLADASQLNLKNALIRFVPSNTQSAGRMIVSAFLISVLVAIGVSAIFLRGLRLWVPQLQFVGSSELYILWFTWSTVVWSSFILQDSALVGLRFATWVPVKNLLFAGMKIGLLVGLTTLSPRFGVIVSWTSSTAVIVLMFNALIFGRLIRRRAQDNPRQAPEVTLPQIVRYVSADYLGSMIAVAAINMLPLLIVAKIGVAANAHYFLAWSIAYSLYLVNLNLGTSLVSETAMDQSGLKHKSYRVFVQNARLLLPMVSVVVVFSPGILQLFGKGYAVEGAMLLRLLALSALPNMVTCIYMGILRIQHRMQTLFLVLAVPNALVILISSVLLERYGVVGIGVAWLCVQLVLAVFIYWSELHPLWSDFS